MFICNFKLNSKKIWKVLLIILIVLIVFLLIFASIKIFNSNKMENSQNDNEVLEITSEEYTNFLKLSHENINNYIGKTVKIVGYVYRLPDFSNNEFVIARTMIIDNNSSAVVVGMLCEYSDAKKYTSGSWIEVTGSIKKGNYNGEIPILEISNVKNVSSPENEFVYLPTD